MIKFVLLRSAPVLFALTVFAREDLPAQFQVWGSRGPKLAPISAEWREVPAESRAHRPLKPLQAESDQGYVLFQRQVFTPIYHDTVPAEFERATQLRAYAARGQYEPLSFAIYALQELKRAWVTVSALTNKHGDTIPASYIDVRRVMSVRSTSARDHAQGKTFSPVPFYLERHDGFGVAQGRTAQLWLTVKVPEKAKPGSVRIKQFGLREITVNVEVPGHSHQETIRVPPQADAWINIDPTAFPGEGAEIKVESPGVGGFSYSQKLRFTRVPGPFDNFRL